MTKLTKASRAHILESVIKATFIPAEKEAILKSTGDAVRNHLITCLPEGFLQATQILPKEWFSHSTEYYISKTSNPRCIMNPLDGQGRVKSGDNIRFEKLRHPHSSIHPSSVIWADILAGQIAAATKLKHQEDELTQELNAVLASCTTTEKLLEKMPTLERHLPEPAKKAYPVTTSTAPLQKALKRVGFDTGAKK